MNLLYDPSFLAHETGHHPENRRRLDRLIEHFQLEATPAPDGEELLGLIHPHDYIDEVKRHCKLGQAMDADTIVCAASYVAATRAVGLTALAAERGDMALVRPPGHHAHRHKAHGFCLFNNIAIATQQLVKEGKRVAIIDFDGHLGDGTESIFYDDPKVLFWSLHQYPAFPFGGFADHIGAGKGRGFTINVPLPPGTGDDIFFEAVQLFWPILKAFQPDVIAVSAGFDAFQFDPLLDLNFSFRSFHHIGQLLGRDFPQTPTFAVLEGGYNVHELPRCVESFVTGVNGLDLPHDAEATNSGLRVWETFEINAYAALSHLRAFWPT